LQSNVKYVFDLISQYNPILSRFLLQSHLYSSHFAAAAPNDCASHTQDALHATFSSTRYVLAAIPFVWLDCSEQQEDSLSSTPSLHGVSSMLDTTVYCSYAAYGMSSDQAHRVVYSIDIASASLDITSNKAYQLLASFASE
jgi:hypothetical protein